ncbi:MAG: P1 family peptidase [Armatimonadetes bacterium]|nr:P1 family peptidase [Armatimonadota bacterium]
MTNASVDNRGEQWGCITQVPGVLIGLHTDSEALTGLVVVRFASPAVVCASVVGGAPGTFGTDALQVLQNNQEVHALVLTGGSVFGLAAVQGVMAYLEEAGIGLHTRALSVPIVAGAVLYDLAVGSADVRPSAADGYLVARSASAECVPCGNVGPGAGATTGKWRGGVRLKGGLGSASLALPGGIQVGALVAVNAIGDLVDPATGRFYAAAGGFHRSRLRELGGWSGPGGFMQPPGTPGAYVENTTIGVVATNALLDKTQLARVANQAQHGLARAIRPVHTSGDGDSLFLASVGGPDRIDLRGAVTGVYSDVVGLAAADVVTRALLRAMLAARGIAGFPAARDRWPAAVQELESEEAPLP